MDGAEADVRTRYLVEKGSYALLYFPVGSAGKFFAVLQLHGDLGEITDGSRTEREFVGTLPPLADRGNHLDHLRYVFVYNGFDFPGNRIGDLNLGSPRCLHGDIDIVKIGVGKHLYFYHLLGQQAVGPAQADENHDDHPESVVQRPGYPAYIELLQLPKIVFRACDFALFTGAFHDHAQDQRVGHQGHHQGGTQCDGNGFGEESHVFADNPRHEQHGQKCRHGRQGSGNDRHGNFGGTFDDRGDSVFAQLVVVIHVFHYNNGVVHDHADTQNQRETDHAVVGYAEDL